MILAMLDFETLDTKPTSQVLSIGCLKFDPNAPMHLDTREAFHQNHADLCFHSVVTAQPGRTMSVDTIKWWMQQSEAARRVVFTDARFDWRNTFEHDFPAWYNAKPRPEACYCFPGSFDLPILDSIYEDLDTNNPIKYYEWRDLRTVGHFTGVDRKAVPWPEWIVEHSALDDCIKQALWVQACYQRLP